MIEPLLNTTASPVLKSVAVTPRGIRNSSNVLTFKVRVRNVTMRSVVAKPQRESVQRANVVKLTRWATSSNSAMLSPLQYAAPISAPTLVPASMRIGIPSSSRTLRTPMCAMPRAKPPPKATPMAGMGFDSTTFNGRDSSRPKACTARITLPRLFIGTPHPGLPGTANPTSTYVIRCHECLRSYRHLCAISAVTVVSVRYYQKTPSYPVMTISCSPANLRSCDRIGAAPTPAHCRDTSDKWGPNASLGIPPYQQAGIKD